MSDTHDFAARCTDALKEAKRRDPTMSWERVEALIREHYRMVPFHERPRLSPKQLQGELFDTLAAVCGLNPKELGSSVRAGIGRALADIRSASPEVTPDEIKRRARAFRTSHRDWPLTVNTLAKYWSEFTPPAPKVDPFPEPPDWKQRFHASYPQHNLPETHPVDGSPYRWRDLPSDMKAEILRA